MSGWKRVVIAMAVLLAAAVFWVQREFHRLDFKPTVSDWQPLAAAAPTDAPADREPCAHFSPHRQAFFGDLHVHTSVSFDAASRGVLGTADDAYRFARGEPIDIAPYAGIEGAGRQRQLSRPLDFAAVTDHAEWIGEVVVCTQPGSPQYEGEACSEFRAGIEAFKPNFFPLIGLFDRQPGVCGEDNAACRAALAGAWQANQAAAERHYDRSSACRFTTFHGYEYSNSVSMSKVHRNVIFRNERVPELPVSSLEEPDPVGLWDKLDALCSDAGGHCEAISIPHNSNVANGRMFVLPYQGDSEAEQRRQAEQRARWEPVVEIMQIKGESECAPGLWQVFGEDELCGFEKLRSLPSGVPEDCEDDYSSGAIRGGGCRSRLDFARYALVEGMSEENRIGINPYRFGLAGSTDTHNATPGDVEESNYEGCCAIQDYSAERRLGGKADGFAGRSMAARNPGGLMGVWAEENSRDALFDAMRRREVFATSGPRIRPRLFAGWNLPEDICGDGLAARGYADGVPMGAELRGSGQSASPLFAAAAVADPDSHALQRLQVVKVWPGEGRAFHQRVYDIAGSEAGQARVDTASCAVEGPGHSQLCATWRDPDFDPGQRAAYYLRVLENPSCRWSWQQCLAIPEAERPAACADPDIPQTIQERAWGSPIWYQPG